MTITELRELHARVHFPNTLPDGEDMCEDCGLDWPCDTIQALDHYDRLAEAVKGLPKMQGRVTVETGSIYTGTYEVWIHTLLYAECRNKALADALAGLLKHRQEMT